MRGNPLRFPRIFFMVATTPMTAASPWYRSCCVLFAGKSSGYFLICKVFRTKNVDIQENKRISESACFAKKVSFFKAGYDNHKSKGNQDKC